MKTFFFGFSFFTILTLLIVSPIESLFSQSSDLVINPGFRVYPDTVTQVETTIAVHPLNPMIVAGAAVTDVYPGGYTTGVYLSTNGGLNWSGKNAIKDSLGGIITTVGNPKLIIDKNGIFILSYIAPNPLGGIAFKVGVSYSTNNGSFWSKTIYIPGVDTADKSIIATDDVVSSPYYGRSYVVYNDRKGILFSSTSNGGKDWTIAKKISPAINYIRTGAFVSVGQSGEIYVTWPYLKDSQKYIGFGKSTNGGTSWDSSDTAIPVFPLKTDFRVNLNLVKLNGLPNSAVDNSGGVRNGWIYIVSCERINANTPATDSCDIVIRCSTNRGATWPIKYKVNQDAGPSLKYQIFPSISVDKSGGINVLYYDTRNTVTNDSFQVYMSRSTNGGLTFTDNLITNYKFKLKQMVSSKWLFGIPSYIGTGISIASSANKIFPFWYDNTVSNEYQAFTSVIDIKQSSSIKLIPEGLYNSFSGKLNLKDSVKFYLRNNTSPYVIIDSAFGKIDSVIFNAEVNFENASSGNYYIEAIHRNTIEVWSSAPVNYSAAEGLIYDFTNSSDKAFGNNLILKDSKWCMYSGDINQDGIIDLEDVSGIENDLMNNVTGYVNTDLNGDDIVDGTDVALVENNSSNGIVVITP